MTQNEIFIWIYEMFYNNFLGGATTPQSYMIHEIALIMTFIFMFTIFIASMRLVFYIFKLFNFRFKK